MILKRRFKESDKMLAFRGYRQNLSRRLSISMSGAQEHNADNLFQNIFQTLIKKESNTQDFNNIIKFCNYDAEFKNMYDTWGNGYIDAIYLLNYEKLELSNVEPYEPNKSKKKVL